MTRARRTAFLLLALAVSVVAVLAGCSGGGDSGGTTEAVGGEAAMTMPRQARVGGDGASAARSDAAGERTAARVLPAERDIVYRGSITVRVRDVNRAADRAAFAAERVDGVVASQQTTLDPGRAGRRGYGEARLTLRLPPAQFGPTLDALGRLGRELERRRSAEDVTTQLADVDARVSSQERSVERLRTLLGEADTVGEVVQIESELARREADLESLQAQLARLRDVTDLATIDVLLVARPEPAPRLQDDDLGFLLGLRGGWQALVAAALVAVTVVGAVLPFAVTAAVLGVPAWLLLRRRRAAVAGQVSQ